MLGIWLLNPYLAPASGADAHLAARRPCLGPPRAGVLAATAAISLLPTVVGFATMATELDLGLSAPWHLLLMIADGEVGVLLSLLWCGSSAA